MDDSAAFDFPAVLRFLLRGLRLALPLALLAGGLAFVLSRRASPVYEATATLLLTEPDRSLQSSSLSPPALEPSNYLTVALSDEVLLDALAELQVPEPDEELLRAFRDGVLLSVPGSRNDVSRLMRVSYRSSEPALAARGANALTAALMDWEAARGGESIDTRIQTLEQQVAALDEAIDALRLRGGLTSQAETESRLRLREQQLEELYFARALRSSAQGLLSLVQAASLPRSPVEPNPARNAVLAALLAVFGTYGVLLLRNALDTRVRGAEQVGSEIGLPVLGEIPRAKGRQLERDAIGYLRTNLLFGGAGQVKSFLITSAAEGEGKSSVALNLAQSFCRNGQRTLLVDADLRRHSLTQDIAPPETVHVDLRDLLEQPGAFDALPVVVGGGHSFDFVPSRATTETSLELITRGFRPCMKHWETLYDVIIVDSAPVLAVADSLAIAPHVGRTILISSAGRTRREDLLRAKERLERVGAAVLGVAVTQVDPRSLPPAYGYASGR